jgi:flagellar hook assembly protein FlgD
MQEPFLKISPNPMTKRAIISYSIPVSPQKKAELSIYDKAGRCVKIFDLDYEYSKNSFLFDGKDAKGQRLPAGVYFIRLKADAYKAVEKFVLAR